MDIREDLKALLYDVVRMDTLAEKHKAVIEYALKAGSVDDMLAVQCSNGNWNYDAYMHGMANGMIFLKSCFTGENPDYLEAPKEGYLENRGKNSDEKPVKARELQDGEIVEEMVLTEGTLIKLDGIPFRVEETVRVSGNVANLELIRDKYDMRTVEKPGLITYGITHNKNPNKVVSVKDCTCGENEGCSDCSYNDRNKEALNGLYGTGRFGMLNGEIKEDLEYFQKQLVAALGVPKEYLGIEEDVDPNEIAKARKVLRESFKTDPDFKHSYMANIRMYLYDHTNCMIDENIIYDLIDYIFQE